MLAAFGRRVLCEICPSNTYESMQLETQRTHFVGQSVSVYTDVRLALIRQRCNRANCQAWICYGLQILAFDMGGEVVASPNREFGYARLKVVDESSSLFKGLPAEMDVWMSHGDQVTSVPAGFSVTALTDDALNAMEDTKREIFGVQFHPEVAHHTALSNLQLSFSICKGVWTGLRKPMIQNRPVVFVRLWERGVECL